MVLHVDSSDNVEKTLEVPIHTYLDRSARFLSVVKATVIKDLTMKIRYKADLVGDIIRSFMFIGVFALFANAFIYVDVVMDFQTTLLFYLCAFMLIIYDGVTLWTPLNSVTNDLYNGTLEYLYSSPNSRLGYYVGNILSAAITNSVIVIPISLFLVFYFHLPITTLLALLLVLSVTILVLIAFGVMFALMGVMFRQVTSLAGILNMLFQFMSGFIFPVQALPEWARFISYVLPYTYGIDLLRYYAISGWVPLFPPIVMWLALLGSGVILWLSTLKLIRMVEKHAKKNGLHLI